MIHEIVVTRAVLFGTRSALRVVEVSFKYDRRVQRRRGNVERAAAGMEGEGRLSEGKGWQLAAL